MSLRMPHSVFIHIPRTGGLWFKEAAKQIGLQRQLFTGDVDSHYSYKQLPPVWQALPAFSFIRYPWSWIKSRWSHCLEHNLKQDYRHFHIHRQFDKLVDVNFEKTLKNLLQHRPGLVGETFKEMTEGVESLYKTKNLPQCAIAALKRFESITEEQEQIILSVPKFNSTSGMEKYLEQPEQVDKQLVNDFLASEQDAITLWGQAE